MQLSELIQEYSIQEVSKKTNIPVESLETLANKEWEKFKKVPALGLLSVIEREFKVDLTEDKEDCKAYFATHVQKDPNRPIDLVDAASRSGGGSSVVSALLTLITLGAIGYGVWFYLSKEKKTQTPIVVESNTTAKEDNNTTKTDEKIEIPKSEKKEESKEKSSYKKFDITASTNSAQSSQNNDTQKTDKNIDKLIEALDKNTTKTEAQTQNSQNGVSSSNNETLSSSEENSSLPLASTQKFNIQSEESSNKSEEINSSSTQNETNLTDNISLDTTLSNEIAALDNTEENLSSSDNLELNSTKPLQKQNPISITDASLNVKSKRIWVGIYNIDTGKRVSRFIKRAYKLNLDNGKLAIITGHSMFDIVTDNGVKNFKGRAKKYLLVSKEDGVKELTKQEYKKLTHNKAW